MTPFAKKKDLKNVSDQTAKPNFYKSKVYKANEVKIKKITKQRDANTSPYFV